MTDRVEAKMTLQMMQDSIHKNAVDHGWWPEGEPRKFPEIVALCHSELSEALEEWRQFGDAPEGLVYSEGGKPEGVAVEMADTVIRILDWAGHVGIDLEQVIRQKMAYNETRPYRHGGKKA